MDASALVGQSLGQTAVMYAFASDPEMELQMLRLARRSGYLLLKGRVGSMDPGKVIAAVEVAARREGLIDEEQYREEHALYHAVMEALAGVGRGSVALGAVQRTAGLTFAVARGPRRTGDANDGDWLAVVFYGTIGAPLKGFEHETLGLGINHL